MGLSSAELSVPLGRLMGPYPEDKARLERILSGQ